MSRGAKVLAGATRIGVSSWLALDDGDGWLSVAEAHLVLTDGTLGIVADTSIAVLVEKLRH